MGDTRIGEVARAALAAFNDSDWNRWRALHAPNVVYDEVATGRRLTGHQDVLAALEGWKSALPDARGEITHLVVGGEEAVCEVTWRGTHQGALSTPEGTVPPSGNVIHLRAVLISKVEADKVVENRQYFDFMNLLRQMGGLPESRAKAAGA